MAMYDNENTIEKSFDLNYISEHLLQAQWAEFVELKKQAMLEYCKWDTLAMVKIWEYFSKLV